MWIFILLVPSVPQPITDCYDAPRAKKATKNQTQQLSDGGAYSRPKTSLLIFNTGINYCFILDVSAVVDIVEQWFVLMIFLSVMSS